MYNSFFPFVVSLSNHELITLGQAQGEREYKCIIYNQKTIKL